MSQIGNRGYHDSIPPASHGLTADQLSSLHDLVAPAFRQALEKLEIDRFPGDLLARVYLPLAAALAQGARQRPDTLVVGVNGGQGAGKTTLCTLLSVLLEVGFGLRVAGLSIDDLYLTRQERATLGRTVHPLLATRGVPGTHDVALGLQLLAALRNRGSDAVINMPVFDKAVDDRAPRASWRQLQPPFDIVLFEGWCVGARPQADNALQEPVNSLEAEEDPQGCWRQYVNAQLAGAYARLFATLDLLIMLEIPGMASVYDWRGLQERKLAGQVRGRACRLMDEAALHRFIMHYERLTRHMLAEMPERADLVLRLGKTHQIEGLRINRRPAVTASPF